MPCWTPFEERNRLVHGTPDSCGWSLHNAEGLTASRSFVDGFIIKTLEVLKVFSGLVRAWQEQANIEVPYPGEHEFFAEIDALYKGRVDDIFFASERAAADR